MHTSHFVEKSVYFRALFGKCQVSGAIYGMAELVLAR